MLLACMLLLGRVDQGSLGHYVLEAGRGKVVK